MRVRFSLLYTGLFFVGFLTAAFASGVSPAAAQDNINVEIVPTTEHTDVSSVQVSPDGTLILSGGFDNSLKLWDAASGRLLRTFIGHSNLVKSVAFSPDGKSALSGGGDGTLRMWDVASGRLKRVFTGHKGTVNSVAFSPDGSRIVSGSRTMLGDDNSIMIWDAASGQMLLRIARGTGEVQSVVFSSDGTKVLSGSDNAPLVSGDRPAVRLWDAATGTLQSAFYGERATNILAPTHFSSAVFSRDGTKVLAGSGDKRVRVLDLTSGKVVRIFSGHTNGVSQVAFLPDGLRFLSCSLDNTIRLWDLASGRLIRTFEGHTSAVNSIAVSRDGAILVSGSSDHTIRIWDIETGKLKLTVGARASAVQSVSFSADGRSLASGDLDGAIRRWDVLSGRLLEGMVNGKWNLATRFNGNEELASVDFTGLITVSNLDSRRQSFVGGRKDDLVGAAISPDAKKILVSKMSSTSDGKWISDNPLLLIDSPTGTVLQSFRHVQKLPAWCGSKCSRSVRALTISPDGRTIASGGEEQTIKIWDASTGKLGRTFNLKWGSANSLQISRDGRTLLTGEMDGGTRLLNIATGELIRSFNGDKVVKTVAFSPDESGVLAGSSDGLVRLWDRGTGQLVRTFAGHAGEINSVAFSSDGTRIATASDDTTVRLWNAKTGELLATLIGTLDGEWLMITPEGFFNASAKGGNLVNIVRGVDSFSFEQFYQSLYRPDLVREKLAGDPRGLVRIAASQLDLAKAVSSGNAPRVSVASPLADSAIAGNQIETRVELTNRGGGFGRVEWRVNGVTVGVDVPSSSGVTLRLSRTLLLEPGNNSIEIVAYNRANLIASDSARVRVAVASTTTVAERKPKLFVLAAGINGYVDQRFKLSYAVSDAESIADGFRKASGDLYQSVEVKLMTEHEVKRDKLDAAFGEIASKASAFDVFVLYLAGHGKTVDGRYHFVPQDFTVDGDTDEKNVKAAVRSKGIAQDQWQKWFAQVPARKSVIMFDTCDSGTLVGDETQQLEKGAANDRLAQATGRSILAASGGSQQALEGYRGHGLFTYEVLDAINQADSDRNGTIEVNELAAYVYAQVADLSQKVFKQRQVPQMKIAANYPLAKQTRILMDEVTPVAEAKPTYLVSQATQLQIQPSAGGTVVRSLSANTKLTVLENKNGWSLIASGGKPIGYVATRDLAPAP